MILVRTPLRVSLLGGGSDYPEYFQSSPDGGAVLGMAINKYVYTGVKRMPPGQVDARGRPIRYRVQYSRVDDCQAIAEVRHPAVRGILEYYDHTEPTEFHMFSDLPGRSGLGSSSSCVVGLLNCMLRYRMHAALGDYIDPWHLADVAIELEREVIKEAVGHQDQIFAAHGGLQHIVFPSSGRRVMKTLTLAPEYKAELEASLILVYSGTMRDAHIMAAKQIQAIVSPMRSTARGSVAFLRGMANEGAELLANHRPLRGLGTLLERAWAYKKQITNDLTTPDLDTVYAKGMDCGALGGKLLGAGGGGFFLFYVPFSQMPKFKQLIGHPTISFQICPQGSTPIVVEADG